MLNFIKRQGLNLFFGVLLTSWGVYGLLIKEGEFLYGKGGSVSRILFGSVCIILGLFFLIMAVLKKLGPYDQFFVICVKCKHPFYKKDTKDSICPNCGGILKDLV